MTDLRAAAQQALEALLDDCLVQVGPHSWERRSDLAITALRAALAEPTIKKSLTVQPQSTHWEGCEEVHPECAAAKAGCEHCNHPLYCGIRCSVCGRWSEDEK